MPKPKPTAARFRQLFDREMSRKDFLSIGALATISLLGIGGVIEELLSHASTPYSSTSATSGTLGTGFDGTAKELAISGAASGNAVEFEANPTPTPTPTPPTSSTNPSGVAPTAANYYSGYTQIVSEDFLGDGLSNAWFGYGSGDGGFYQDPGQYFGAFYASQGSVANSVVTMINSEVDGVRAGTGFQWAGYEVPSGTEWPNQGVSGGGIVEVMAKCSVGQGVTMCLGLIAEGGTWPPEIDFYEDCPGYYGSDGNLRNATGATVHYGTSSQQSIGGETGIDATQWHIWSVEWTESTITVSCDHTKWSSISNPQWSGTAGGNSQSMKPFFQIETNDGGPVTSATPAVVTMEIDWITIYQAG